MPRATSSPARLCGPAWIFPAGDLREHRIGRTGVRAAGDGVARAALAMNINEQAVAKARLHVVAEFCERAAVCVAHLAGARMLDADFRRAVGVHKFALRLRDDEERHFSETRFDLACDCRRKQFGVLAAAGEESRAARLHPFAFALRHAGDPHRAAMWRGDDDRQIALLHRDEIRCGELFFFRRRRCADIQRREENRSDGLPEKCAARDGVKGWGGAHA